MRFYLGTHLPSWLAREEFAAVPLFVSRRRLMRMKHCPRALGSWALDSGGFTELSMHGRWTCDARWYLADVRRFVREVGVPDFVAPQDWMCEPQIVERTGLSVATHQRRTVENFVELRALAPDVSWMPVLQGFTARDYDRCVRLYERAGVDLFAEPRVGLGTVCRRQGTDEIATLIRTLASSRLRLHGFGVKAKGLAQIAGHLSSSDSLAWSFAARREDPPPGCTHANCANCPRYAARYYRKIVTLIAEAT